VAVVIADPKTKQDLARQGLHRPREPQSARPVVGRDRGRPRRSRVARGARLRRWNAASAGWAERNPAADLRLKAARPLVEQLAVDLRMPTRTF
jgi:ribonuclease D